MILLVDKIEKSFGARVLFSGASFQINPGERFALVGPNGAGKTTMLKIIMGIDSPDAGQVQYAKDCQVGYLEQETNLEQKDTTILAEVMAADKEIRQFRPAPAIGGYGFRTPQEKAGSQKQQDDQNGVHPPERGEKPPLPTVLGIGRPFAPERLPGAAGTHRSCASQSVVLNQK